MNYLKKIYKPFFFLLSFIFISIFILTLLNYFNIIGFKLTIYLKFILSVIAFLIGGFKIGIKSTKKGWLEGIKFSLIILIIMSIFTVISSNFEFITLNYYSILMLSSVIGSMFGITKKRN